MLDPCLTQGRFAEVPPTGRGAMLFGSTAGVTGMELAGLEPAASWVRFGAGAACRPAGFGSAI